jgi:quercetin dioxygenase-like cupin family protein
MDTRTVSDVETVEATDGVHLTQLVAGERTSVQHFHFEPGAVVPEHDHEHEQTGLVTRGALTFTVGGEEVVVSTGESYVLRSDEPHAAENRGDVPATGIDVFSPPRVDVPWRE